MDFRFHVCAVIASLFWASSAFAAGEVSSTLLEVTADAVQPAGAPVLLVLIVRNTGKSPLRYWWSGPSDCPDARDFKARVTYQGRGITAQMDLSNGQTADASGRTREILPGRFVRFSAAMRPMPPGAYTIDVLREEDWRNWPTMKAAAAIAVQVSADPDLIAARDSHIIARVRANDPFAQYVAASWPRKVVKDALVEDLKGNNVVAADRAAEGLWFGAEPPPEDGAIVADAIIHHLKASTDGCDLGLMDKLLKTGSQPPSNDVRMAASRLTTAREDGHVRSAAVATLNVPARPVKEVWIPHQPQPPVPNGGRGTDLVQVARHDAMLKQAQSNDPSDREFACRSLSDFPESLAAVEVLRTAVHDPDINVRMAAIASLDRIAGFRELRNELPFPATRP
jgi:hypothetical protein